MKTLFTQFGLGLDIIGVIILFRFGPPISALLPNGSELIWSESLDKGEHAKNIIRARNERRMSFIGLLYIFIGFIMQFISSII